MLISQIIKFGRTVICTAILIFMLPSQVTAAVLDDVLTKVNQIFNKVDDVQDRMAEVHKNFKEGVNSLTDDMRARLQETLADAQGDLQQFIDGRDQFLGNDCDPTSPCADFRTDLTTLIANLETLSNGIVGITFDGDQFDFTAARAAIQSVPGRALFPLYKVLAGDNGILNSVVIERIGSIGGDLILLEGSLGRPFDQQSEAVGPVGAVGPVMPPDVCQRILAHPTEFQGSAYAVTGLGFYLRLIGKIMTGLGELDLDADGGIHGYVHVEIKNNQIKKYARWLDGAGVAMGNFAAFAMAKAQYCQILSGHQQILEALNQFDPDFSNLDIAVSSRASQASVDAVASKLDDLDTAISAQASQTSVDAVAEELSTGLGNLASLVAGRSSQASVDQLAGKLDGITGGFVVTMSSRASQSSLDDLAALQGDHQTLMLRIQVERSLTSEDAANSIFYLPGEFGGLLELVRDVVADTIVENQAAGIHVHYAAEAKFDKGDRALSMGDYKRSYEDYRKAYRLVVSEKGDPNKGFTPGRGPRR